MTDRKAITQQLSLLLEERISNNYDTRVYWSKEVTFDYYTDKSIRVDYMKFTPINNTVSGIEKGDFSCYEVKSSVEDFHSKNGHNFIGDFNYYVMPKEVYKAVKQEIPYDIGVYVPDTDLFGQQYLISFVTTSPLFSVVSGTFALCLTPFLHHFSQIALLPLA